MKWILRGSVVAWVAVALTGCSSPEPPDEAAVQQWLQEHSVVAKGIGNHLAGLASTTSAAEAAEEAGELDGVRIDLAEPQQVTVVEFSCFGAETMDAHISMANASGTVGASVHEVRCAEEPFSIDVAGDDVTSVSVNGVNDNGYGAWAATFH